MTYPLTTARLVIDRLAADDIPAFVEYRQDPVIAQWQSWEPTYSVENARGLVESQPTTDLPGLDDWMQLAVRRASDRRLLGDVAVHTLPDQPASYEIGVTVARPAQGEGFATEAVDRLLLFLFDEVSAHRVVAFCDSRNHSVARLLTRVGMRQESRQVDGDFFKDEWTTLDGYAILDREWRDLHAI